MHFKICISLFQIRINYLFTPDGLLQYQLHQPMITIGVPVLAGSCDSSSLNINFIRLKRKLMPFGIKYYPVIDTLYVNVREGYAKQRTQKVPQGFRFSERPVFRTSDQSCNNFGGTSL